MLRPKLFPNGTKYIGSFRMWKRFVCLKACPFSNSCINCSDARCYLTFSCSLVILSKDVTCTVSLFLQKLIPWMKIPLKLVKSIVTLEESSWENYYSFHSLQLFYCLFLHRPKKLMPLTYSYNVQWLYSQS